MTLSDDELIARSCELAAELERRARSLAGPGARRRQRRFRRLLASPSGAKLVFAIADRVLVLCPSLTIEEPPLRDPRDFLVVLRTFDMPSSDIQLVKLYRIIEGLGVLPDRQADLAEARAELGF